MGRIGKGPCQKQEAEVGPVSYADRSRVTPLPLSPEPIIKVAVRISLRGI